MICNTNTAFKYMYTVNPETTLKEEQKLFLRPTIAHCRSKVLHSAILLTSIKVLFVIKTFVLSILSGRLRQGLLYMYTGK